MTTRKLLSSDFFINGVAHELRKHIMPKKFSTMSFEECCVIKPSSGELQLLDWIKRSQLEYKPEIQEALEVTVYK